MMMINKPIGIATDPSFYMRHANTETAYNTLAAWYPRTFTSAVQPPPVKKEGVLYKNMHSDEKLQVPEAPRERVQFIENMSLDEHMSSTAASLTVQEPDPSAFSEYASAGYRLVKALATSIKW